MSLVSFEPLKTLRPRTRTLYLSELLGYYTCPGCKSVCPVRSTFRAFQRCFTRTTHFPRSTKTADINLVTLLWENDHFYIYLNINV